VEYEGGCSKQSLYQSPRYVSQRYTSCLRIAYFSNVGRDDGRLGEEVQYVVQPWWEVRSTIFGKIHARDRPQFDAERLKKDGKDV
jgi:hypothetical protein